MEFEIVPAVLLPAPCPLWKRWWLTLRRKPLPTMPPPGARAVTIDYQLPDGSPGQVYFPAAFIRDKNL